MKIKYLLFVAALSLIAMSSCTKDNVPSEEYIKTTILGKWRYSSGNGVAVPTNRMKVGTFATEDIYYSTWSQPPYWYVKFKWNYTVEGTQIGYINPEDGDVYYETVKSIDHNKMVTVDSYWKFHPDMVDTGESEYTFISKDYSRVILGTWEGVSMEGEETYGDAKHRFEYRDDGTYTYYNLVDGKWVESDNTQNNYVADGDFLATRWFDKDCTELREWWIIELCNDEKMTWYALREKEDGSRFETRMYLKRIN